MKPNAVSSVSGAMPLVMMAVVVYRRQHNKIQQIPQKQTTKPDLTGGTEAANSSFLPSFLFFESFFKTLSHHTHFRGALFTLLVLNF